MPQDLSKYFRMLLEIRKSSVWPAVLRQEYVSLFGLDSINAKCNMSAAQSVAVVPEADDNKESEDDLDEEYVHNGEIEDASEYLHVMNASIEYKEYHPIEGDQSGSDVEMNVLNANLSADEVMNENVNVLETVHRERCPRMRSETNDNEPVHKKRRLANSDACTAIVNKIQGNIPSSESLNKLSITNLRQEHLEPHKLKVSGVKWRLVQRIMRHYKKEHDNDLVGDDEVVDDSLNACVRETNGTYCACGAIWQRSKVRNVYRNRNYVDCTGKCKKRITNGRQSVYHCSKCKRCVCDNCIGV
eukprot:190286_1